MNIRDTQRAAVTERLSSHILAHGLARSSLRELAAAAGVSDRMLLYYFDDKSEERHRCHSKQRFGRVS